MLMLDVCGLLSILVHITVHFLSSIHQTPWCRLQYIFFLQSIRHHVLMLDVCSLLSVFVHVTVHLLSSIHQTPRAYSRCLPSSFGLCPRTIHLLSSIHQTPSAHARRLQSSFSHILVTVHLLPSIHQTPSADARRLWSSFDPCPHYSTFSFFNLRDIMCWR